jgi:cobalt-zinc-cadmium efflux system membrane fusion protein
MVKTGRTLDGNMIEILSGIGVGQQVIANALDLQNTADQQ